MEVGFKQSFGDLSGRHHCAHKTLLLISLL